MFLFLENGSFRHTDNRKKDIPVLSERSTDELDDTTVTLLAKYYVNITKVQKEILFESTLQCSKHFLYANGVKIYQFLK